MFPLYYTHSGVCSIYKSSTIQQYATRLKRVKKETDIGFMERGEHSPEDSSSSSIIIKGLQSLCLFVLIFNNSSLLYIEVNLFETWDFDYKCQAAFYSRSLNNSSIFSTNSEALASKLLENLEQMLYLYFKNSYADVYSILQIFNYTSQFRENYEEMFPLYSLYI